MKNLLRKIVFTVGTAASLSAVSMGASANCFYDYWGNRVCAPPPVYAPAPPVCYNVPVRNNWGYIIGSRRVCN